MVRYVIALIAVIACSVVTTTAFGAPKGFFIGGGLVSRTTSGDLDGKSTLVDSAATVAGSVGKIDNGTGFSFDIGYNFTNHFGLEYMEASTIHTANHTGEPNTTDAVISTGLAGVRLSAGLGDHFDVFARLGVAVGAVSYDQYGHKIATGSNDTFTLTGGGYGYGVGAEAVFGKHLGFGIGYTVYNVTFSEGDIAGTTVKIKKKQPSAQFQTPDFTFLYHF
ncbi:MAG TPA: outer membrane beta-barrel protein [Gemmatimonadaceae bacterium]